MGVQRASPTLLCSSLLSAACTDAATRCHSSFNEFVPYPHSSNLFKNSFWIRVKNLRLPRFWIHLGHRDRPPQTPLPSNITYRPRPLIPTPTHTAPHSPGQKQHESDKAPLCQRSRSGTVTAAPRPCPLGPARPAPPGFQSPRPPRPLPSETPASTALSRGCRGRLLGIGWIRVLRGQEQGGSKPQRRQGLDAS